MEEFLSFIADILEVDKNTLTLETSQDDVETWDSLMQLRLLGEIEAKYGVMIPMERISAINPQAFPPSPSFSLLSHSYPVWYGVSEYVPDFQYNKYLQH